MRRVAVFCVLTVGLAVASTAFAAEPEEEVIGKWATTGGKEQPMEFLKDGKCKFGWSKDKGKWEMADGTYKITKEGKISATAESGGVSLKMEFKLDKGAITGMLAGKDYTWKKEEKKDDKKDPKEEKK